MTSGLDKQRSKAEGERKTDPAEIPKQRGHTVQQCAYLT